MTPYPAHNAMTGDQWRRAAAAAARSTPAHQLVRAPRSAEALPATPKRFAVARRGCERVPRGIAVVSFIAALLVIGTMILWLFAATATTNASFMGHYYSTGAFYAAESGVEMSMREQNQSPPTDIDSDGTIGSISDNGSTADDPTLVSGAFYVHKVSASPVTFRAYGRPVQTAAPWSTFKRTVEVQTQ